MSRTIDWPCAALAGAPLAPRTTMRVGGRAEWLLEPARPEELVQAWTRARERGLPVRVLGGGANLLVEDGLHEGVVIATDRMARVFRPAREDEGRAFLEGREGAAPRAQAAQGEPLLVAWAGAPLPGLVRIARDLAWSGLEGLAGVPGQLGGGVAMNAGGRWGELWDVVERVRLLLPSGEVVERARADCAPRYRDGALDGALVLGAILRLRHGDARAVRDAVRDYLAQKSAAQPVTERSSGCIFRNPDPERSGGRGAGKLIEDCGGKGLREGDAIVSPKHANFVVNLGRARSRDVLALIERVERLVEEKSGVRLEREVCLWRRAPEREQQGASL